MDESMKDADVKIPSEGSYLPPQPWFVARMTDCWGFALITAHDLTFLITSVHEVERDECGVAWLRVELRPIDTIGRDRDLPGTLVFATCDRTTASIRMDSVIAAVEMWDT